MTGWIKVYRTITDNWTWSADPFSRGQAWIALLLRAAHSEYFELRNGVGYKLLPGQLVTSEHELAEEWRWSRTRLRNFFALLVKSGQIEAKQDHKATVVTILKWRDFQGDNAVAKTTEEPLTNHSLYNKNSKNEKNTTLSASAEPNNQPLKDQLEVSTTSEVATSDVRKDPRTGEPLIAVPFPEDPGRVFMTARKWQRLLNEVGEAAAHYLVEQLEDYARDKPRKFAEYKDHYRTLMNWHRQRIEAGRVFFQHPTEKPGYYAAWVVENFKKQNQGVVKK